MKNKQNLKLKQMKAIVNVHPRSAYAKFNGLTFEVSKLYNNIVDLLINNTIVSFTINEVFIVDFLKERKLADNNLFDKLENYRIMNNFKLTY